MNITLMDGRSVNADSITWNRSNYHFLLGNEDITNLITRADKLSNWSGFDVRRDNSRLSVERPASGGTGKVGPAPLLPSGWSFIAGETIRNTAQDVASGAGSYIQTTTNTLIIFGVVGIVAYLLLAPPGSVKRLIK